jgi:hypothetical protein
MSILMGSDDGVQHSELLSFWTLSIVQCSKKLENTTFRKLDLFPSSGRGGGGSVTPLQLRHGLCCRIRCFKTSTDPGHGIQVEDKIHVREVQVFHP